MYIPDPHALELFWADDPDTDAYHDIIGIALNFPPLEALRIIRLIIESAPDDDALCKVGVWHLEPLLDTHGLEIRTEFEDALAASAPLRKALSCADLRGVPRDLALRWYASIQTGEDVGRSPSSGEG